MKGFMLGLVAGGLIGAGGFWGYFMTGGTIQEFAQMRCWIATVGRSETGAPVYTPPGQAVDPDAQLRGASELAGPDKAQAVLELCRVILE